MITKKELTDLTIERLNGGAITDYRKYHPNVIGRLVDIVLNSLIAQDIASVESGISVGSDWIKTINKVPIKWDNTREQCYIEWAVEILMMQGNRGVREIGWPVEGDGRGFFIQSGSSYGVLADLECSDPENGMIALIEGKRVYFPQMPRKYAIDKRKLTAKVVLAAAEYDNDDPIPVPEERFIEAMGLIDQLATPMKMTRVKVTNDTNPNTI